MTEITKEDIEKIVKSLSLWRQNSRTTSVANHPVKKIGTSFSTLFGNIRTPTLFNNETGGLGEQALDYNKVEMDLHQNEVDALYYYFVSLTECLVNLSKMYIFPNANIIEYNRICIMLAFGTKVWKQPRGELPN